MGRAPKGAAARSADPKVTQFVETASVGDLRTLKKLIKAGKIEIDDDVNGVTALMKAAGNGHMPVVEELLYHGAGMWCAGPTDDPKTPFMWAAHHGHLSVIRYFVEEVGLDDLAINKGAGRSGRKTAMDYALDAGHNLGEEAKDKKADVLFYLGEHGAEHGEGVTDPETVFDGAAAGDVKYVHFCLEANGDIIHAAHGAERSSLLHVAGNTGNEELAKNLISHGADIEARNAMDRTPLMSAARAGNIDVLRLLLDKGVALEHRDANGDTALHHACEAGHLECVRALLSREGPSAEAGTDGAVIVQAMLEGDAPEHQPPARQLSPMELLAMKNKEGYTPVIKAFAGGVHVSVIRYVVGIQDGNVDPVKCGQMGAEEPAMLTRQVSTDGIVLQPPSPPPPEDPEQANSGGGGAVGGLFTCGEDGADEQDDENAGQEIEEYKDEPREAFFASTQVPYPVYVPPGPPSVGHRRMTRFIRSMKTAVWGFSPDKVYVLSRPAVMDHKRMIPFQEAMEKSFLVPLSSLPPGATLLYVSHRWAGLGEADSEDGHAMMQLNRYLGEHAGEGIHYVWIDCSCVDVAGKEAADYETYMNNVVTVLSRSTHMLAVPPCKLLNPRDLVRDMSVAKMEDKAAAAGESPEFLKKVPSTLSMKAPLGMTHATADHSATGLGTGRTSHNASFVNGGVSGGNGHINGINGGVTDTGVVHDTGAGKKKSISEAVSRAVEKEVDLAILTRKATHPDKWSMVLNDPDEAVLEAHKNDGSGGGKPSKAPSANPTSGDASSVKEGDVGGAAVPSRASPGGGVPKRHSSDKKDRKSSKSSAKKASATLDPLDPSEVDDAQSGGLVMTKKERNAMLEVQARQEAASAATEVTHDMSQMPAILKGPVYYSDPASFLNRGWVEMEVSLALVFGVEVLVCARWGAKVTFQTVLVRPMMSEDGVTEEQALGFKGAFLHGIERIAPDVEEQKGLVVGMKRTIFGAERRADPTVPLKTAFAPMLDLCHEPQSVVAPLVRASLTLHNEGALVPFLAGDLTPVDIMYRLSGLALQDVKDGFAGLGPISDERDKVTLVRLYLLGLSYAMGVLPKGKEAVGKPKWQVLRDYADAQKKITVLKEELTSLQRRSPDAPPAVQREAPSSAPPPAGCGCVLM